MSRLLPVGGERYLVWLTGTNTESGEPFEWCVATEDSEEEAKAHLLAIEVYQEPAFASGYRIERIVIADPGERTPLVCKGPPEPTPEVAPAPLPEGEVFF